MSSIDWSRIEDFIGYGRIDAPIVLVGMEEGLASEAGLRDDLALRSSFAPVMDLEEAHRGIVDGESLFSDSPRRQPTWRVMADLMLHFEGKTFSSPQERSAARRAYRAKRLGRSDGDSLLMELLPYPHRNAASWLYTDRFPTREEYVRAMLPARIALLREALASHPRTAIVCYGRADWPRYKQLFADASAWAKSDRFETATWRAVKVTLSDHFASHYFNTDEELDKLSLTALPR